MISENILVSQIGRRTILLFLLVTLQGCDIAQESVYILTETNQQDLLFSTRPSQASLFEALQLIAATHDTQCRQHIKRWDEWNCNGPMGTRVKLQKEPGKDRYVVVFTLVIGPIRPGNEFQDYVNEFINFMEVRFGNAVLFVAQ